MKKARPLIRLLKREFSGSTGGPGRTIYSDDVELDKDQISKILRKRAPQNTPSTIKVKDAEDPETTQSDPLKRIKR